MAWSPDGRSLGIAGYTQTANEAVYLPANGQGVKVRVEANFKGWGPTIDHPFDRNLLVVIGALMCGVGILFARIRKAG